MRKGQISFDFIIAIGFFVLFLQSFLTFNEGLMNGGDALNTRMQAESIVGGIGQIILIGNTAAGASNVSISYDAPIIKTPSGKAINTCTITLNPSTGAPGMAGYTITIDGIDTISKSAITLPKMAAGATLAPTTIDCSNATTITYSK